MGTFTGRPVVSGDDGRAHVGGFNSVLDFVTMGNIAGTGYHGFFRVPSVAPPKDATIVTAKLTFKAHTNQAGATHRTNIYMNDSDNAVAPTSLAEFNALVKTTAFTVWDGEGAWIQDTLYDSGDFTGAVQEVVNRGGWATGNAMMVLIYNDLSDANAYRNADSQDLGETTAALLTITYTSIFIPKASMF